MAKTINGKETYNKIVQLKPEVVFTKYNMKDMNSIDIMENIKRKIPQNIPIFNIFADELPKNEKERAYNLIGKNLNALVNENDSENIVDILKDYKEYKEYKNLSKKVLGLILFSGSNILTILFDCKFFLFKFSL